MKRILLFIIFGVLCYKFAYAGPQIFMAAAKKGTAALDAPGSVSVSNSPAQLTATWNDLSGETSYELFYSTNSSLDATTYDGSNAYPGTPNATAGHITGIAAGTLVHTLNGMLTESTTYYIKIAGRNTAGLGTLSAAAAAAAAAVLDYFGASDEGWTFGIIAGGDVANASTTYSRTTIPSGETATGGTHSTTSMKAVKAELYTSYFEDDNLWYWDSVILTKVIPYIGMGNFTCYAKGTPGQSIGFDVEGVVVGHILTTSDWEYVSVESIYGQWESNRTLTVRLIDINEELEETGPQIMWIDDITTP